MKVTPVLCHKDNYSYVVSQGNSCLIIDACEARPIQNFLNSQGLTPVAILTTHSHWDHIGGNEELAQVFNIPVYGHYLDPDIPKNNFQIQFKEGEKSTSLSVSGFDIQCFWAPGHMPFHTLYYIQKHGWLFTGDTFFSCGCGRLFDGAYEDLFHSLQSLLNFPEETQIYFGHEYSLRNALFAKEVLPHNPDLASYIQKLEDSPNFPSVPTTLALEKKVNPFLQWDSVEIQSHLECKGQGGLATFIALRKLRDQF